jgi:hypothetical protein
MPHPRRSTKPFSFEIKREYNNKLHQKGRLSEIIDFHVKGRNRYMKINQPTKLKTVDRDWTRFKNPLLNKYDVSEEDDGYERKHYVFDYIEEEDENAKENDSEDNQEKSKKKSTTNKNTKRLAGSKSANEKSKRNTKKKSNDEKKVDEKKVGDTVKMLEGFLKENPKPKKKPKSAQLPSENELLTDKSDIVSTLASEETFYEVKEVSEEEQNKLFLEKNIQVNISTMDNDNVEALTKKPDKTSISKESKTISTQTPRDVNNFYWFSLLFFFIKFGSIRNIFKAILRNEQ